MFTESLREPIRRGEVDCTVRFRQAARVKVGNRYVMEDGAVEVLSLRRIELADITPALARRSGFAGVVDLLKVAKHGAGQDIYLIDFVFHPAD